MIMRLYMHIRPAVFFAAILFLAHLKADACTVFIMTGGDRVLLCNNEDFSNPNTRIWFIPGMNAKHGCQFVGFDDGWGQGGLNDKGLAFAWVAGFKERWHRRSEMQTVHGNPAQRMLESCDTVEEAIDFFKRHWEESFSYGKMLVADRGGKSAIIGATDGALHSPISTRSQGMGHWFGMRGNEATQMLSKISTPTLTDAVRLLEATRQEGANATKYSVIYDLKTCDIYLYPFPEQTKPVRFHLPQELQRGPHSFDIPELPKQLQQKQRPLTEDMKQY